jgi:alpha-D-xyloside xylohydrolase
MLQATYTGGLRMWIDGRLVIDHWRQDWLPATEEAPLHLEAGHRYGVRVEWICDKAGEMVHVGWRWLKPGADTSLWSEAGRRIDYYFLYGPGLDRVVAGYRELTGRAPLMPIWAFGLWQSRQRYKTQEEILDVARGFRSRGIPLDVIVQDWFYWKADAWGSHAFDPGRFPDPDAMIRTLHETDHLRYMISVWPKFYPGTENFRAMQAVGFLYQPNLTEGMHDWVGYPFTFYDAFNPGARSLYWKQINSALFRRGVDAWWLDASEPDMLGRPSREGLLTHMVPSAAGRVATEMNAYPLLTTGAVFEGQRAAAPGQRVFILTRSAYAGQQRNAAATWSGDISSTWTAMRKQIPAGLGFSLSGIPYWTMDTGGFAVPPRWSTPHPTPEDQEEWRELNARWFEFAAFVPILRVHGEFPNREMWELGGEAAPAYQAELRFDRLRYRLLPYIYSQAAQVTFHHATLMRALVMDFPDDPSALDIADEYQFGAAFLVSPVTSYRERQRSVYLPKGAAWYDFWTGEPLSGGQRIKATAPLDRMPLHVRAGSIVPFGPDLQYTAEKPADPITLVIYAGADGAFELYEDDGLTTAYETGECSRIGIRWNDATHTLDIGGRRGSYGGMLRDRIFQVVRVSAARPAGYPFPAAAGKTIRYSGEPVSLRLDTP